MNMPTEGQPYTVRLDGGPLDGEHRSVVSLGGLNRSVEFEIDGATVRYVSRGAGHFAGGRQVWSYDYDERS